jgi:hypothetical protein
MTRSDPREALEWAASALSSGCVPECDWASCFEHMSCRQDDHSAGGDNARRIPSHGILPIDVSVWFQRLWRTSKGFNPR